MQGVEKGINIPKFRLYHDRKSFGTGSARVTSTVTVVQCRQEEAKTMKQLMTRAQKELIENLRLKFVPSGYHLSASPQAMIKVLNCQNKYINNKRIIAIIGLTEDIMEGTGPTEEERIPLKERLRRKIGAERIERTNRTCDLGKWLVMTDEKNVGRVRREIDGQLDSMVEEGMIKESNFVENIGWPRRTDRSMGQIDYEEGIRLIQEEFLGEGETDEGHATLERNQTNRTQWHERHETRTKQKKSYAQIAESNGKTKEQNNGRARDVVEIEETVNKKKEGEHRLGEREETDVHINQVTQEERRNEPMIVDTLEEIETKSTTRDEKFGDTLRELEEMQKRNEIILTKQEEDKKLLRELQEELSEFKKKQTTILTVMRQHEAIQVNQGRDIKEIISQLANIQKSIKMTRDTGTRNKKGPEDGDDSSYDEEL